MISLSQLILQRREEAKAKVLANSLASTSFPSVLPSMTSSGFQLTPEQYEAGELAFAGKSFCLTGAAGSGKTTAQREVARNLLRAGKLGYHNFKIQGKGLRLNSHGVAFVAFTTVAAINLRKALCKDAELEAEFGSVNVTTIHNLLEFEPVPYSYTSPDTGELVESVRFEPQRTALNPLTINYLIVEEASMVSLDLWKQLHDALPSNAVIIFLGDINQLPPVFGDSIFLYALQQLPVLELTSSFRNIGIVLSNARKILSGTVELDYSKEFKLIEMKKDEQQDILLSSMTFLRKLKASFLQGTYLPDSSVVLTPFNVQECGVVAINTGIADFLGKDRNAVVFHIIAGFLNLYLAVGDRVLVNKKKGIITKIAKNYSYMGKRPSQESTSLSRYGVYSKNVLEEISVDDFESCDTHHTQQIAAAIDKEEEDKTIAASHSIQVLLEDTEEKVIISSAGDFAFQKFQLGYCMTVHKAQGSEWDTVYIIAHPTHATMLSRELLYTAVTRARTAVVIFSTSKVITRTIQSQRIKGATLKEKIQHFTASARNDVIVPILPS